MRIIISPAKKMTEDVDGLPWQSLPDFLPQTEELLTVLRAMPYDALKALWRCNDQIAALNAERLSQMDLHHRLTPAILCYEGIQYRYMAPSVFTADEFAYVQEHVRILSGFYGVLRPFDGVRAYRLEMQTKLKTCDAKDLYTYWGAMIAEKLFEETACIINLASKEYSQCISRYLRPEIRLIDCVFGEEKDGKVVEKGTMCKMARGEMVRYLAENQVTEPEKVRSFDRLQFCFSPEHSREDRYVFLRPGMCRQDA